MTKDNVLALKKDNVLVLKKDNLLVLKKDNVLVLKKHNVLGPEDRGTRVPGRYKGPGDRGTKVPGKYKGPGDRVPGYQDHIRDQGTGVPGQGTRIIEGAKEQVYQGLGTRIKKSQKYHCSKKLMLVCKTFPHPMVVFCTHLEPPKPHIG